MKAEDLFNRNTQDGRQIFALSDILHSLAESVRKEFPYPFWMKADISKINFYQYSGHAYPELVEKKDDIIVAQTKAIIWKNDFRRINDKFVNIVGEPLKDGISIVCLARMTYHPLYGFSLVISDIDPDMTLGQLEKEKMMCIERLKNENLFNLNSTKTLPLLPQRLAVISVISSKGYNDFIQTIEIKKDKFKFFVHLFPSLLQGDDAGFQLTEALNVIESVKDYFDCVLIIRGGGGDIGLTCYNNYELCRKIATFPLPVLTGIGHSTNETVAEMVAFKNFITPTALAEFLTERFENFSANIDNIIQQIRKISLLTVKEEYKTLSYMQNMMSVNAKNIIEINKNNLRNDEKYLKAINPVNILKKGYTITLTDGNIVKSVSQITKNTKVETITADGRFSSTVD